MKQFLQCLARISFLFLSLLGYSDDKPAKLLVKGIREPFDRAVEIEEPCFSSLIYDLPISSQFGVTIFQGPLNLKGDRSHGYYNCLYALDFSSCLEDHAHSEKLRGKILAARDGVVIGIHNQGTGSGAFFNDDLSGDGFGNWIAIEHKHQEVSFYAHLKEVSVKVGDKVKQGQEIGLEGSTGHAGHRHLHFSVHRFVGNPVTRDSKPYSIYQYECIPYQLRYIDQVVHTVDIRTFAKINQLSLSENKLKLFPIHSKTSPHFL